VFATAAVLAACGGSGSGSVPIITTQANNVVSVVVDAGPAQFATGAVDTIYTTITICAPGSTSNCQTIDHIQVDTGSSGLRILGSVLSGSLGLPTVNDNVSGNAIAECAQFADGYSWGPLRQADLQVGGEKAQSLNVQVIGDTTYTTVPADCSSTGGTQEDTVAAFGANGILGVGPFIQDCGPVCAASVVAGAYYVCPTPSSCQGAAIATALQVNNPVASFATDNNGVLIMLPSVPTGGAANVMGSLIFGIGTQTNNALGTATVLTVDPNIGVITTNYLNHRQRLQWHLLHRSQHRDLLGEQRLLLSEFDAQPFRHQYRLQQRAVDGQFQRGQCRQSVQRQCDFHRLQRYRRHQS